MLVGPFGRDGCSRYAWTSGVGGQPCAAHKGVRSGAQRLRATLAAPSLGCAAATVPHWGWSLVGLATPLRLFGPPCASGGRRRHRARRAPTRLLGARRRRRRAGCGRLLGVGTCQGGHSRGPGPGVSGGGGWRGGVRGCVWEGTCACSETRDHALAWEDSWLARSCKEAGPACKFPGPPLDGRARGGPCCPRRRRLGHGRGRQPPRRHHGSGRRRGGGAGRRPAAPAGKAAPRAAHDTTHTARGCLSYKLIHVLCPCPMSIRVLCPYPCPTN
jgi:hypothetical protein